MSLAPKIPSLLVPFLAAACIGAVMTAPTRADGLEDDSAGVVLGPRDAEGTAEQRCRAPTASQLRKRPRHRRGGEMRQPHDQLEESAPEPFHDEHLTGLEGRPAEIRGHETA